MMQPRIFISYSRDDWNYVDNLADKLQSDLNYSAWFDREITLSQKWWDEICDHICDTHFFIALLTPRSLSSPYCRAELEYAHSLNKGIMLFALKPINPDNLPVFIRPMQCDDIYQKKLYLIVRKIKNFINKYNYQSNELIYTYKNHPHFPTYPDNNIDSNSFLQELEKPIACLLAKTWLQVPITYQDPRNLEIALSQVTSSYELQRKGVQQLTDVGFAVARDTKILYSEVSDELNRYNKENCFFAASKEIELFIKSPNISKPDKILEKIKINKEKKYQFPLTKSEASLVQKTLERIFHRVEEIVKLWLPFSEDKLLDNVLLHQAQNKIDDLMRTEPNNSAEHYKKRYARYIENAFDKMEILGINVDVQRYPLENSYITLTLQHENQSEETLLADRLLSAKNRWILLGEAGSGKSTLLRWIAVRAASNSFPVNLVEWNNKVPFLIILREFADGKFPSIENLSSEAARVLGPFPKGWTQELLTSGHAIILIDGIDEIEKEKRSKLYDWVNDLVSTYHKSIFILTSRPLSNENDLKPLVNLAFAKAEFQAMQITEVLPFIDAWFNTVAKFEAQRRGIEEMKLISEHQQISQELKNRVQSNPSIFKLTTNPLLCAAICAIFKDKDTYGELPSNRLELYKSLCEMLVAKRDEARRLEFNIAKKLDRKKRLDMLKFISHHFLKNDVVEMSRENLYPCVERKLKALGRELKDLSSEEVIDFLLERSALLNEPVKGTIGFAHKSILEYLAAEQICYEGDIGLVLSKSSSEQWRLSIIFTAGLGTKQQKKEILEGLLKHNTVSDNLLSISCLELLNEDDMDPNIVSDIRQRFDSLIPPASVAAAKDLAAAGDLVVPYLADKANSLSDEAAIARCIFALSRIGTTASIEALKQFSKEVGDHLLVEYWEYFDRREYAENILYSFESLELKSLEGVQFLKNLKHLKVNPVNKSFLDLTPLTGLTNLVSIEIRTIERVDGLNALQGLKNLSRLCIHGLAEEIDFVQISRLTQLEDLELSDLAFCTSLYWASDLHDLHRLHLSGLYNIDGIRDLIGMWNLRQLFLYGVRVSLSDVISIFHYIDESNLEDYDWSNRAE